MRRQRAPTGWVFINVTRESGRSDRSVSRQTTPLSPRGPDSRGISALPKLQRSRRPAQQSLASAAALPETGRSQSHTAIRHFNPGQACTSSHPKSDFSSDWDLHFDHKHNDGTHVQTEWGGIKLCQGGRLRELCKGL